MTRKKGKSAILKRPPNIGNPRKARIAAKKASEKAEAATICATLRMLSDQIEAARKSNEAAIASLRQEILIRFNESNAKITRLVKRVKELEGARNRLAEKLLKEREETETDEGFSIEDFDEVTFGVGPAELGQFSHAYGESLS